ncbi:MAG: citryl-CoA lyase [Candidatus Aenigmarchaeota archaeon]|nr:citryl-CoA lyase [Candidatus Aenigmarchaeota archaeon]
MSEKSWKTKIADSDEKRTVVRGYTLEDLIDHLSFSEMVYLVLKGTMPTKQQARVMDAMLVASAEHGIATPSVMAARTVFSGGNSFNAAVAAGVATLGEYHGGAIEQAAKILQEQLHTDPAQLVKTMRDQKKRMPGYGHKIYTIDSRAQKLFSIAKEQGIYGAHCKFAEQIEQELEKLMGKKLCINIDGCIAAIISDMEFDWRMGKAFFIIPRTLGLCAHVYEEATTEKPFRRLDSSEYDYMGEEPKPFRRP